MSLTERLRVMAARWEEWLPVLAADPAANAADAVGHCIADLRGELKRKPKDGKA